MGLVSGALLSFFQRNIADHDDKRSLYIFYKIVNSYVNEHDETYYQLHCINTKAVFDVSIKDMIFDSSILCGLHPIQACYIGIEYAKELKKNIHTETPDDRKPSLKQTATCRYGKYNLLFQDRKGNLGFIERNTSKAYVMDPRDVALSKELIEEFDSAQAFYIGLTSGLKLSAPMVKQRNPIKIRHLQLVQ